VLAHLDGETQSSKAARILKLRDSFLRKSHAPVEVTVEAKDNDPLTGPKWGASPIITLIPPDVGEPEARRIDALRGCATRWWTRSHGASATSRRRRPPRGRPSSPTRRRGSTTTRRASTAR